MGENNGTRVSPNGEPEIAEIEPSKEVEQINDPSHPIDQDGMGEQSPVVASDSAPVERGKPLIPWSFLEGCETEKKKEIKSKPPQKRNLLWTLWPSQSFQTPVWRGRDHTSRYRRTPTFEGLTTASIA